MKHIRKIVVGIDLSYGDRLVAEELSPPTKTAIARAKWLAQQTGAKLCFFHALDVDARTAAVIKRYKSETIMDEIQEVLGELVAQCEQEGIAAQGVTTIGRDWHELIRHVLRTEADLVIVGTRNRGSLSAALLGSMARRLIRKCPCPVWVTKPAERLDAENILVATDFSPACDVAIDYAAALARTGNSNLHVLHVMDFPEKYLNQVGIAQDEIRQNKEDLKNAANVDLEKQLSRPDVLELQQKPQVHMLFGQPDSVIIEQTQQLQAQLLIMGSVGRMGIRGVFMGNTAEKILSELSCSVLAVKPPNFETPISIGD